MKGNISLLVILSIVLGPFLVQAQLAPERLAWNNLGKERWAKSEQQIKKALRKDSLDLGVNYVYAWYFFTSGNPEFNIDSASFQTDRTIQYFNRLNKREKEKAARFPFDSVGLFRLKTLVDSAAFQRATAINTEAGYMHFVTYYTTASQLARAIELQHEVAFLDALKENTYQAYDQYLKKYPQSQRKEEAKSRYEKLLFEIKTKEKKLNSYRAFVKEYPQSPYRITAEQMIFEISTASGEIDAFQQYVNENGESGFVNRAKDFLYHLVKEKKEVSVMLSDSLRKVWENENQVWFPLWKNGQYGFMNALGEEKLLNVGDTLSSEILCEGLSQDIVLVGKRVLARNGKVLADSVEVMEDLGAGFLKVNQPNAIHIVHRSGHIILKQNAELLGNQFLLTKEKEQHTLYTLTGRKLFTGTWIEVQSLGGALAFKTEKGWKVASHESIGAVANGSTVAYAEYVDEVKRFNKDYIVMRKGAQQALYSNTLKVEIPFAEQKIKEEEKIIVLRTKEGAQIFSNGQISSRYADVQLTKEWVMLKSSTGYTIEDRLSTQRFTYDSAALLATALIGIRNDTLFLQTRETILPFGINTKIELLNDAETSFFSVLQNGVRTLFSATGERLISITCDKLEYVGANVLIVTKKDKKTLMDVDGKILPLTDFETFGNITQHDMAVLSKKKFGLINRKTQQVIKPTYERSLRSYNHKLVVAFKDGFYGFISWENKVMSTFEFEEVRYWNDSVAWVRHNFSWRLLNLGDMTFRLGKISSYTQSEAKSGEKLVIYRQDNYYGVMSNQRGVILEPTYTDIQNLGTADEPFFFTEKYVEEAEIYVALYYSGSGKQLRRQVFEEEEFSRIKCIE